MEYVLFVRIVSVAQKSLLNAFYVSKSLTCVISVTAFHAAMIPDKTSTLRFEWPRGAGPKIPANQVNCSSSGNERPANQRAVVGYRAAPVTNACHMTVTPMETVTRNKTRSWIWKGEIFCNQFILVQNASDSLPETFQQEKCVSVAAPEIQQRGPSFQVATSVLRVTQPTPPLSLVCISARRNNSGLSQCFTSTRALRGVFAAASVNRLLRTAGRRERRAAPVVGLAC